jgi:hypothetical protein
MNPVMLSDSSLIFIGICFLIQVAILLAPSDEK